MNHEMPSCVKPGGAGARLWVWLAANTENLGDNLPLSAELCGIADRLEEVRAKISIQGIVVSGPHGRSAKNPLLDVEIKLSKQFQTLYRSLGLCDKDDGQGRLV